MNKSLLCIQVNIPSTPVGLFFLQVGPMVLQVWPRVWLPKTEWTPLAYCFLAGPVSITWNRTWSK